MSPAHLPEAPWKLNAWHDAQRAAAPNTVSGETARARFDEAMAHLGYPASIWARRSWLEGERQRSGFINRGVDATRRLRVWRRMREPRHGEVLSYPEIARACGMPSHSTIVMAVRRAQRRAAPNQNGGGQ